MRVWRCIVELLFMFHIFTASVTENKNMTPNVVWACVSQQLLFFFFTLVKDWKMSGLKDWYALLLTPRNARMERKLPLFVRFCIPHSKDWLHFCDINAYYDLMYRIFSIKRRGCFPISSTLEQGGLIKRESGGSLINYENFISQFHKNRVVKGGPT